MGDLSAAKILSRRNVIEDVRLPRMRQINELASVTLEGVSGLSSLRNYILYTISIRRSISVTIVSRPKMDLKRTAVTLAVAFLAGNVLTLHYC